MSVPSATCTSETSPGSITRAWTRRLAALALLAVLVLVGPGGLAGQSGPGVDVTFGVAVPIEEFRDGFPGGGSTATGITYGVHLSFPIKGWSAVYLGFAEHRFECADSCGVRTDMVSTSWRVGGHLGPFNWPIAPFVRLGLAIDRSEADLASVIPEPRRQSSDLAVGPDLGVGVAIRLAERFTLAPTFSLTRHEAVFLDREQVDVAYGTAGLTLHVRF